MLPQRVMDLPGWPPQPGGAMKVGSVFPTSTDEVNIERVVYYAQQNLMFSCKFGKESVIYHFPLLDPKNADKVSAILHDHIGQTLTSIAFVELPKDEE